MTTSQIYVRLSASCQSDDMEDVLSVIVRFDNEEQWQTEADQFYDYVHETFSNGLPDGWKLDSQLEADSIVSEKDAKSEGFQIFK